MNRFPAIPCIIHYSTTYLDGYMNWRPSICVRRLFLRIVTTKYHIAFVIEDTGFIMVYLEPCTPQASHTENYWPKLGLTVHVDTTLSSICQMQGTIVTGTHEFVKCILNMMHSTKLIPQ